MSIRRAGWSVGFHIFWRRLILGGGCPQIWRKVVAAVDFVGVRTYVRHMGQGDGYQWRDDCPLPDVAPVDLPDDEPEPIDFIDEAHRAARSRNVMDGQIALAVLHELHTTSTVGLISARDLVAAEIGPALGIGSRTATDLVDVCVALHTRLPATLRAVCAGDLSWYKAVKLAELTAALSLDLARRVEDMVLAKAGGRTPARHA